MDNQTENTSDITHDNLLEAGFDLVKEESHSYYSKPLSTCLEIQVGSDPFNTPMAMLYIGGEEVSSVYIGINTNKMADLKLVEDLFYQAPMDFADVLFIDGLDDL